MLRLGIVISYVIEFISAYIFFSAAAEKRVKQSTCYLVGFGLFAIACVLNILGNQTLWLNLFFYILANFLYGYLCFELSLKKSLFYGFILTLVGTIWEMAVEIFFMSVLEKEFFEFVYGYSTNIFVACTCKSLLFITVLILSRFVVKGSDFKTPISFFIYPGALMISLVIFTYVCAYCGVNAQGQMALAIVSLILIVPTTLLFLIYQRNIEKENELFRLKNEMDKVETEKTYYDILDKQNQDLRIYAHDAKNHLAAIRSLNTNPEIEEYLNKITESLATYSKVSRSGNHSLDVIINRYVTECSIKDVKFIFDTRLKNLEYVEGYDLVTILGNLLDNALESAEKSENREITLSTDYRNTYDVLIVTNSCDTPPKTSNNKLITTKTDKKLHGIGLKSVAKTLSKYNGDYDWEYDEENKVFTATVMLRND
ncbi:MAG: GHKL domain-containing protein [Clostridia bacterium]|nr:GHKL domain-containing protein [Clostridia bacterium]